MTEKQVEVENINYHTVYSVGKGRPRDAAPILLIHALMANHHMWDSTVIALNKAGYNTLQVDNIGHNRTTAPSASQSSSEHPAYHFDDLTRHFHTIVRRVTGQDQVEAVIGCSMGGVIALRFGLLYPDAVVNCIVCCDAPGATSLDIAKAAWSSRITQFRQDLSTGREELKTATAERWLPGEDEQSVAARAKALEIVRTCSFDGYKICADGIRSYDYQPLLENLKVRTMILAGREDSAIGPPKVTEDIASAIPAAKLVWMEKTGHLPPLHRPQEFELTVLEFLQPPTQDD